jgi:hypothetical protein
VRLRPSCSARVRRIGFHGHRPNVINASYISIGHNQTHILL